MKKSLFRRGQAQLASRNFELAIHDFETLLDEHPSNAMAKQLIAECHQKIKEHKVQEKDLYNSFFKKPVKPNVPDKADNTKANGEEDEADDTEITIEGNERWTESI